MFTAATKKAPAQLVECFPTKKAATRSAFAGAAAAKVKQVSPRKLVGWAPKLHTTCTDVAEGRLSYNTGKPVVVSKLDSGEFWIVDGHHRAIEAVQRGDKKIGVVLDEHVPRIEHTGGAYASVLSDRANVGAFVDKARCR